MIAPKDMANLQFPQAAQVWLQSRTGQIGARTIRDYAGWIRILNKFFADLPLADIHIGHIQSYQQERSKKAGPICINHELNTLSQILARAGLWAPIAQHYRPLKIPKATIGRALEASEEERLWRLAASRPRWRLAYLCSLITANTTAGPGEIRNLRLRDVVLSKEFPHLQVTEGTKNEYRIRDLPLNASALYAVEQLLKRAKKKGAVLPEHYLLPHYAVHKGENADPTRPMGSWKRAWERLREAAGMPHLRMYDLRHHAITRLLEDENVSERTVIELAGHVSKQMLNRYSHIRMKTKQDAVNALQRRSQVENGQLRLIKN
jgi:integrase